MARNTYVRTASGWEQVASTVLAVPQGLVPIVPTSVAGTGVSVDASGVVTFSGSTSVSLNGVFTSAYKHYRIVYRATGTGNPYTVGLRLRAAGVDASTANYLRGGYISYAINTGSGNYNSSGEQGWLVGYATNAASISTSASIELASPALAEYTLATYQMVGYDGNHFVLNAGGTHPVNTAYDGFTLVTGSGALTGTIQVFGYSKGGTTQPAQLQPYSYSAGSVAMNITSAANATVAVTFPVGRFSVAPIVTCISAGGTGSSAFYVATQSATSTGMNVQAFQRDNVAGTATFNIHWQAVQMTSASASG